MNRLRPFGVVAAFAAVSLVLVACGDDAGSTAVSTPPVTEVGGEEQPGGESLQVALLLPGLPNDGSFNQAAAEGIEALAAEGLVEFEIRSEMADPAVSEPVVRQYAEAGYDLIIGHGIELSEPILGIAPEYPDVHFTVSGGADIADKLLPNVDGWTYDFAHQGYLSGFVAAKVTETGTVAIVGGPELPFVTAAHEGFKAGVAAVDPAIEIVETYTGSFDDVQRAVEATAGLISQGADVVFCSGDGICNGVATAASQGGVLTVGVTGDAGGLAEQVNIASVELNMVPTFTEYATGVIDGTFGGRFFVSGLANGGLVLTPVNALDGVPDTLDAEVAELLEGLASGEIEISLG